MVTDNILVEKPPTVGIYIRDYLRASGPASATEIHREYKRAYKMWLSTSKVKGYRLSHYSSFAAYMSGLARAGLVEKTGEVEESDDVRTGHLLSPDRVYLRLTSKGERAPNYVWMHPLRLYYRPLDWERRDYGQYIRG